MYKSLMGCSLFSNSHFHMGVTVMGLAEHFGHCLGKYQKEQSHEIGEPRSNPLKVANKFDGG